jgi:phospholipid/cholesterol/gamma-HCH transport system substrate-binding protein
MDRDANYVAVGAFVLLVVAMAVGFVFWYTDLQNRRTYGRYEIYFEGSVSGLTEGGPIRFLGVDVGQVKRMMIDPARRNRVLVIADVDATTPLDNRTVATLSLQGVTGLLFINLKQDPKVNTTGPLERGLQYPVIRSAPADFDVLLSNLPALATHMVESVDRFNRLLSDDNLSAFKKTIENARLAGERLPATVRGMQDMATDMRDASHEVRAAAADMLSITSGAGPDVKAAVANIRLISDNLAVTSKRLDQFVADNAPGMSHFTTQSLPEIERLLREAHTAARDFRDLSRSLKENPSQVIYESNYRGLEVPR